MSAPHASIAREYEADVVVIGGGGAGLAAASMAATLGRKVVLLEKNSALGGSTAYSVGSVAATSTPHQVEAGILDCPEDHWQDMLKFAGTDAHRDNPALARVLAEGTPEMFRWLMSAGLDFVGPMPEPPHRRPRMHNVLPNSRAFPYRLGKLCASQGVTIVTGMRAERIVLEDGRAVAVEVRSTDGGMVRWRARGGIVLAAGDYSAGRELKARFASAEAAMADAVNPTNTGDGIHLGLACGGEVVNGDHVRGPFLRFVPPERPALLARLPAQRWITWTMRRAYSRLPPALLRPVLMKFLTTTLAPDAGLFTAGAALVDLEGGYLLGSRINPHLAAAEAPQGCGIIVFDERIARRFCAWPHFISTAPGVAYAYLDDYRRTRRDIYHCAPTVEALALRLGMDPQRLRASIAEHNVALKGDAPGADPARALSQGPYHALGPARAYVVFTNGGLRISERMEVLRTDGHPIAGLYAAGANGQGGLLLEGHGHHLGWAFVSGRLAGRHAALARTTVHDGANGGKEE